MTVTPRPIAWITTINNEGLVNVAPFSFFTCLSSHPPLIGVTIMNRKGHPKDTLQNIMDRGEFVINVVTEDNLKACNLTSIEAPRTFSEAEYAHLALSPSKTISVPRLQDSPIHLECCLNTVIPFGADDQAEHPTHFVVGEVLQFGIKDHVLKDGNIVPSTLRAVGRLSGPLYSTTELFLKLKRPQWSE